MSQLVPAEALGVFVNHLALIWEDSHGKWPGRTYDVYTGKEGGRFRQFVDACLNGVDPARSCPDGIIRSVLRGRKIMEKYSRQSKPSNRLQSKQF